MVRADEATFIITDADEARLVDDAMKEFHRLVTVNDTENLGAVNRWLTDELSDWVDSISISDDSDGVVDHETGHFCDQEDTLRSRLHRPQRLQPKGDSRGRARKRISM